MSLAGRQCRVLEGPGLDYNVDAGPERLFSVFGNRLYMPDGNFAGIDPVEPSTVSHTCRAKPESP